MGSARHADSFFNIQPAIPENARAFQRRLPSAPTTTDVKNKDRLGDVCVADTNNDHTIPTRDVRKMAIIDE